MHTYYWLTLWKWPVLLSHVSWEKGDKDSNKATVNLLLELKKILLCAGNICPSLKLFSHTTNTFYFIINNL